MGVAVACLLEASFAGRPPSAGLGVADVAGQGRPRLGLEACPGPAHAAAGAELPSGPPRAAMVAGSRSCPHAAEAAALPGCLPVAAVAASAGLTAQAAEAVAQAPVRLPAVRVYGQGQEQGAWGLPEAVAARAVRVVPAELVLPGH